MPRMPDWLANMMNTADNLVEDSPEFRRQEQESQVKNLENATNQALRQLKLRNQEEQRKTVMMQQSALDRMTPVTNPMEKNQTPFFGNINDLSGGAPAVPTSDDFANTPVDTTTQPNTPPEVSSPPGQEDPVAIVNRIAQTLGIPAQQVAAMALLGQDIRKLEDENVPTGDQDQSQTQPKADPNQPQLLQNGPPTPKPGIPINNVMLPTQKTGLPDPNAPKAGMPSPLLPTP